MGLRTLALCGALALACVASSSALAAPPTRSPAPFPDQVGRYCADFDVLIHADENREVFTAFEDGRGLITGTFKVTLTNLATEKQTSVNASGPVFLASDGSTVTLGGRTLLFGEAGFFGPGSPPTLSLVSGNVVISLLTGEIQSVLGSVTDLCAVLADP
jgi:hypothetical protein